MPRRWKNFLASIEKGETPRISELIERYPEVGVELKPSLEGLLLLHDFAANEGIRKSHSVGKDSTLGDFRILREIGQGGMGVVYEAEQISLERRVALKTLPYAALLDKKLLRRFQTEAKASALLKHDHRKRAYSRL